MAIYFLKCKKANVKWDLGKDIAANMLLWAHVSF